ncbi:transposase [Fusibacter sp. 3D3]|uniref:transposase n=1 Tax=Fusibacter sp. 3D3 TaxID=1048380 RepID=UPI000852EBC6|nr:transposase [Fusibacter sp. 3D3]GAU78628.1 hypothetical protein F3D3_3262 [Fusibacter sp. 3D3]
MSFKSNQTQQLTLEDHFLASSSRTQKFVLNSWAKGFSEIVFPAINEDRFAILYSDTPSGRPNTPVNAVIGSLILKELFGLTDDDLLASILCDVRFQFALHTTSFEEQPFSDRTFSRFRERLYDYEMETGIDLLQEEMISLADYFVKYLGMETTLKRMDSLMISSSAKKMSRLEIVYTCVFNMVKLIHQTGEIQYIKSLEHYLDAEDRNTMIYHRKSEEQSSRLQQVIDDANHLIAILPQAYSEFKAYQLLKRVLEEQSTLDEKGSCIPKHKTKITPSSLQNPSDPDATYRTKAGKSHKGYVGNVVETFDKKGSIITAFDYATNSHSDSQFCKETIEKLGPQAEPTTLLADGAYTSIENTELATENNIELITTALLGKAPDVVQSKFEIDVENKEVLKCPIGQTPYKTRYYESTEQFRVSFNKAACLNCPLKEHCGIKMQKKSAVVMISEKMIKRATYLEKISAEDYRELSKKRNGVEGIPSILRRRYHVDRIPVRGLLRSKMWFTFKIGAINVKSVLKAALILQILTCFFVKTRLKLTHFYNCLFNFEFVS